LRIYLGRLKPQYFTLRDIWTANQISKKLPEIERIISPVNPIRPGKEITVTLRGNFNEFENLKFEWEMRRDDILDKVGKFEYTNDGSTVKVKIPKQEGSYRIYAYVSDYKGRVDTASIPIVVQEIKY